MLKETKWIICYSWGDSVLKAMPQKPNWNVKCKPKAPHKHVSREKLLTVRAFEN